MKNTSGTLSLNKINVGESFRSIGTQGQQKTDVNGNGKKSSNLDKLIAGILKYTDNL